MKKSAGLGIGMYDRLGPIGPNSGRPGCLERRPPGEFPVGQPGWRGGRQHHESMKYLLIPLVLGMMFMGLACRPRVEPEGPGVRPAPAAAAPSEAAPRSVRPPVREMVVGELCPAGAAGRPGVMPLFVRGLSWSDATEDAAAAVARRMARQFSVLAWDGRRAGIFSVAGGADVGLDRQAAAGAYAGVSPCARPRESGAEEPALDAACVAAQAHCGLALAVLEPRSGAGALPFAEDPEPVTVAAGGACVADDKLIVDLDQDGEPEAFPVAQFVDPVRAPAGEVSAVPRGGSDCATSAFAIRHVVPPGNPKHWLGLDLLGVVDIDGDGRRELVVSYHYPARRTWAIYSPLATAGRLDLVGEAEPWPSR